MTNAYVVGDSSPFLKRVLIPFWVVRIFVMLINIAVYGIIIVGLAAYRDEIDRELRKEYNTSLNYGAAVGISVVICIIIVICLILDIVNIVKRARRTLSPKFFLITSAFQTTVWTVLFALSMVGARTGATIGVGVIIYLSFVGMLIYAGVIFHKHRKGTLSGSASGGAYKPTQQNDIHSFNPNTSYGGPQPYAPQQSYAAQQPYATQQPYAPQDYGYGGAQKDHQQYQAPQYGYGAQGGEAHEMQPQQRV